MRTLRTVLLPLGLVAMLVATALPSHAEQRGTRYPGHTDIVATTFWVGEIFDPSAEDGSQMFSTYDDHWFESYGGCDGVVTARGCETERRTARNGYFPTKMKPRENPFYLDLPYDDLNDRAGFAQRRKVVPWADKSPWRRIVRDPDRSIMKNRWVKISRRGHHCYGQIQDAGPGKYHDKKYVFGTKDARPANKRYNRAGMDVSPALNGCLHFSELNGDSDRVDWRFVDYAQVPPGPWKRIITRS
ncbi:hypothetical protein [Aeromicrobium yanjiei]|uniref:Secreted protein n=1 Tax=Aeromicrobium yanjiei TaxID=2662028 RepID=A0A5Q2MHQ4_9ACTN|nr:hypothetical protein [Aeromicrobium yanjiei]QGG41223.1 hypothetical protein GEV26_07495 [Aeromicrobium yanjiei]